MKVALIYPPDRNFPGNPYASLPTLASCLESQGHAATLHDVNLEVFLSFTQDARLLRWYERLADRMTSLGEKDSLAPAEAAEYDGLVRRLSIPVDSLARAPQALEVMNHAAGFYDPGRFNRAFDDLRAALQFYFGDNPLDNAQTAGVPDRLFELLEAPLTDPVSEALTQGILDDILAQKPDLVGISIPFMVSYWEAMKLMRLLKTRAPGLPIVVGGALVENHEPIFVGDPRLFSLYDFVIAGDGDRALPRLATALEKGTSLGEVPNLYVPDAQGKAAFTFGEAVRNLNALPAPDFTGLPLDRYPVPETGATFQTSRGCYYGRCTFCSESFRDNYRLRKPEKVVEDMVRVYQTTGITHFYFWDSLCPPRTLKHVAEQVKIRGLPFTWFAETKMEKVYLPPEFMQTLFDGGCRFLQFGFESASQRVLDLIDKDNHLPEVEQVLTNMEQAGIKASLTWFIGFPTETAAEARLTYDTIRRLGSRVTISAYSGVYHLLPDQPLFHQQDRFGI
ncbi:MAG: B12-binding domain-containing radical SAM protein, partial [Nitrospinaceae bacterium]